MAAERLPILETRTLCEVRRTLRECSFCPLAAPFRRRLAWVCVRRARPAALATPKSFATVETWTGLSLDCFLSAASTAALEATQVVFLRDTSSPSSARLAKSACATRRPLAATWWGFFPQKSTDKSSTQVSAVATAGWLKDFVAGGPKRNFAQGHRDWATCKHPTTRERRGGYEAVCEEEARTSVSTECSPQRSNGGKDTSSACAVRRSWLIVS